MMFEFSQNLLGNEKNKNWDENEYLWSSPLLRCHRYEGGGAKFPPKDIQTSFNNSSFPHDEKEPIPSAHFSP